MCRIIALAAWMEGSRNSLCDALLISFGSFCMCPPGFSMFKKVTRITKVRTNTGCVRRLLDTVSKIQISGTIINVKCLFVQK